MGYSLMKDISANVLPEVKATLPEDFAIEINGRRYSRAVYPEPIAAGECFENSCNNTIYPDYWLGAYKACNKALPTLADFTDDFFPYFYKFDESSGEYVLDEEKVNAAGFNLNVPYYLYLHISSAPFLRQSLIAFMPPVIPFNQTPEQHFDKVAYGYWELPTTNIVYVYLDTYNNGSHVVENDPEVRQFICKLSTPPSICEKIKDWYNIKSYDCTISDDIIQSAATSGNFAEVTPNIVLLNGSNI